MTRKKISKSFRSPKKMINWAITIGLVVVLFVVGPKNVFALIQRVMLKTGIANAKPKKNIVDSAISYDFRLKTLDGKIVPFSDFRNKTVFVNVWATWCPPCIAEMPEIQSLYDKVASEDIVFVMISADRNLQKAHKFVNRKKYRFPVYTIFDPMPKDFASNAIPITFVISPQGKIVYKHEGMAGYDNEKFRKFLKGL